MHVVGVCKMRAGYLGMAMAGADGKMRIKMSGWE